MLGLRLGSGFFRVVEKKRPGIGSGNKRKP